VKFVSKTELLRASKGLGAGEERSDEWKAVSYGTSEESPKKVGDKQSSLRSSCPLT